MGLKVLFQILILILRTSEAYEMQIFYNNFSFNPSPPPPLPLAPLPSVEA